VSVIPSLYLLAGPNGAGKTTLYKALVKQKLIEAKAEFVNADIYEAGHLQHIQDLQARSQAARHWADQRRSQLLQQGQSFVSETVFSHESKLSLIDEAIARNFYVLLLMVGLDDPTRLIERVKLRVAQGGHMVPPERILARYPRTLDNLKMAAPKVHRALFYDTSGVINTSHQLVAIMQRGKLVQQATVLPRWVQTVLN
jgi:predicted ABC-type ATPase